MRGRADLKLYIGLYCILFISLRLARRPLLSLRLTVSFRIEPHHQPQHQHTNRNTSSSTSTTFPPAAVPSQHEQRLLDVHFGAYLSALVKLTLLWMILSVFLSFARAWFGNYSWLVVVGGMLWFFMLLLWLFNGVGHALWNQEMFTPCGIHICCVGAAPRNFLFVRTSLHCTSDKCRECFQSRSQHWPCGGLSKRDKDSAKQWLSAWGSANHTTYAVFSSTGSGAVLVHGKNGPQPAKADMDTLKERRSWADGVSSGIGIER